MHEMLAEQLDGPLHATLQRPLPHEIEDAHEPSPAHVTSQLEAAWQLTLLLQLSVPLQSTMHARPAGQVIDEPHDWASVHENVHVVSFVQVPPAATQVEASQAGIGGASTTTQ
jgi:hypothetical protein